MSYYVTNENSVLNINNAHLKVSGNIQTDVMKLGAIEFAPPASDVPGTVNFTNVTTGVTTSSNLNVGGTLMLGSVELVTATAALEQTVNLGNVTSNTVQFTNAATSLVASGNVVVTGNVTADHFVGDGSNITGISSTLQAITDSGPGANVTSNTVQFTNATTGIVATGNVEVGGELTVSGNVVVDTNTLFVDSVNNRVGVGTTIPSTSFHVQTGASDEVTDFKVDTAGQVIINRNSSGDPFIDTIMDSSNPQVRMGWNGNTDPKVFLGSLSGTPSLTFRFLTANENSGSNTLGKLVLHRSHRSGIGDQVGISCVRRSGQWDDQADMEFYVTNGGSGKTTAMAIRSTGTADDSRVGILRTDPTYALDVKGSVGICNPTTGKTHQHWSYSGGTDSDEGNLYLRYMASGYGNTWKTRIRGADGNQALLNFTGQHKTYIKDIASNRAEELEGLIVSANTNKYMKMSDGVEVGQNAITVNESLPIVNISNVYQDKKCFGVISTSEDSNDVRGETIGCFTAFIHKEDGDTRVHINSLGEGALWVVNTNGTIESGDYVTTSNIAGYGMKQDSECFMNYTVAKSTMDCDFNPLTQKKRRIVKELREVAAWVLCKYEEVSEQEYNDTPEDKRKIEDDTFKIEREYVSRHDPDNSEYTQETRIFEFSVLDENNQLTWEDMDDSELEYKIRYLDANGNITTEENAAHKAAFIGCTYHCG